MRSVKTEDGYTFYEQKDGKWSDHPDIEKSDMVYDSYEGLKDHIHKEWTGQNETEDELFRIIKAMFLRFQEKKGCIDLTELRDDVLNEIHDHLIQGR